MPQPDEESEHPPKTRRRPSHFRKKRKDTTTKLVRVSRERASVESDVRRLVQGPQARQEQWRNVINPAPTLPDPLLHRPIPPPAPLPSEMPHHDLTVPGWLDDRQRRKRVENIIGTVGLALMVAAMLAVMWLQMTGP